MSPDEAATLIRALSEALEVPTQNLLAYYMARIPALWVQGVAWTAAGLACLMILRLAMRALRARKAEWEAKQDKSDALSLYGGRSFDPFEHGGVVPSIVGLASGVLLFMSVLIAMDAFVDAMFATAAPEAYAIDAALRSLRG